MPFLSISVMQRLVSSSLNVSIDVLTAMKGYERQSKAMKSYQRGSANLLLQL